MGSQPHLECLSEEGLKVFRSLKRPSLNHNFILAGDTALAIQLGHRRSIDFDFFSTKPFSTETLIADLKADAIRFKVVAEEEGTLLLTVRGGKTSFFHD